MELILITFSLTHTYPKYYHFNTLSNIQNYWYFIFISSYCIHFFSSLKSDVYPTFATRLNFSRISSAQPPHVAGGCHVGQHSSPRSVWNTDTDSLLQWKSQPSWRRPPSGSYLSSTTATPAPRSTTATTISTISICVCAKHWHQACRASPQLLLTAASQGTTITLLREMRGGLSQSAIANRFDQVCVTPESLLLCMAMLPPRHHSAPTAMIYGNTILATDWGEVMRAVSRLENREDQFF